jgi:hypothetical protein
MAHHALSRARTAFDWCFRDRSTGRIVIGQFPNIALTVFMASVAVRWVADEGSPVFDVARWVGTAALLWWAVDEVVRGVNPWRRVLGLVVAAFVVAGR